MIQMRIPVDLEKIIDVTDEIYTFSEVMDRIELRKYYSDTKRIFIYCNLSQKAIQTAGLVVLCSFL